MAHDFPGRKVRAHRDRIDSDERPAAVLMIPMFSVFAHGQKHNRGAKNCRMKILWQGLLGSKSLVWSFTLKAGAFEILAADGAQKDLISICAIHWRTQVLPEA